MQFFRFLPHHRIIFTDLPALQRYPGALQSASLHLDLQLAAARSFAVTGCCDVPDPLRFPCNRICGHLNFIFTLPPERRSPRLYRRTDQYFSLLCFTCLIPNGSIHKLAVFPIFMIFSLRICQRHTGSVPHRPDSGHCLQCCIHGADASALLVFTPTLYLLASSR